MHNICICEFLCVHLQLLRLIRLHNLSPSNSLCDLWTGRAPRWDHNAWLYSKPSGLQAQMERLEPHYPSALSIYKCWKSFWILYFVERSWWVSVAGAGYERLSVWYTTMSTVPDPRSFRLPVDEAPAARVTNDQSGADRDTVFTRGWNQRAGATFSCGEAASVPFLPNLIDLRDKRENKHFLPSHWKCGRLCFDRRVFIYLFVCVLFA